MTVQMLELSRTSYIQVEQDKSWVNMYVADYGSVAVSLNRTQLDELILMLRKARKSRREYDSQNLQS